MAATSIASALGTEEDEVLVGARACGQGALMVIRSWGYWGRDFKRIRLDLGRPDCGAGQRKGHGGSGCGADMVSDQIWDGGRGYVLDEGEGRKKEDRSWSRRGGVIVASARYRDVRGREHKFLYQNG